MGSRQLEIARTIDRPEEPRMLDCTTPVDKVYKAHCMLLDVLSRQDRGLEIDDDRENLACMAEAVILIGDAFAAVSIYKDPAEDLVHVEGRRMADAARRLREVLMGE